MKHIYFPYYPKGDNLSYLIMASLRKVLDPWVLCNPLMSGYGPCGPAAQELKGSLSLFYNVISTVKTLIWKKREAVPGPGEQRLPDLLPQECFPFLPGFCWAASCIALEGEPHYYLQ